MEGDITDGVAHVVGQLVDGVLQLRQPVRHIHNPLTCNGGLLKWRFSICLDVHARLCDSTKWCCVGIIVMVCLIPCCLLECW